MMEGDLLETDRKRYADDVTVQELVRLRVENERLREALSAIAVSYYEDMPDEIDAKTMWIGCTQIARFALQQKDSE